MAWEERIRENRLVECGPLGLVGGATILAAHFAITSCRLGQGDSARTPCNQ